MNGIYITPNIIKPEFKPNSLQLSLEAIGMLLQMSNVPEFDYCKREDLYRMNPTWEVCKIDKIIDELIDHQCLIETNNHRLAVNKFIIVQAMQLVHGNLLLRTEG